MKGQNTAVCLNFDEGEIGLPLPIISFIQCNGHFIVTGILLKGLKYLNRHHTNPYVNSNVEISIRA